VDREDLAGDVRAARLPQLDHLRHRLVWADVWPLLIIAVLATPLGLAIFKVGERYAKKHGKLKRSG
jgi:hypothetical protein